VDHAHFCVRLHGLLEIMKDIKFPLVSHRHQVQHEWWENRLVLHWRSSPYSYPHIPSESF